MATPKTSIITPSFNQGPYIEETIDSVLSQGYTNLEYIIIDGGSTDNTVEVIKKYEKHLKYWVSEPDNGQSHAINKGFKIATGDVFNWLNSDDLLAPNALKEIARGFQNPTTNIFLGRSIIFSSKGDERKSRGTDIYTDSLAKTLGRARIDQPEHWWRKSVLDDIGPLNQNLHYIMDRDWWVKYLLRFGLEGIQTSESILARFRLHSDSKTVSQSEAFNAERNAYYRSLALHYGLKGHADNLANGANTGIIQMTDLPEKVDFDMLNASFQHFYALLCEEAYATGNHKQALEYAHLIEANILNDADQSMIDKIRIRAHIPASLIRTVKNITGRK